MWSVAVALIMACILGVLVFLSISTKEDKWGFKIAYSLLIFFMLWVNSLLAQYIVESYSTDTNLISLMGYIQEATMWVSLLLTTLVLMSVVITSVYLPYQLTKQAEQNPFAEIRNSEGVNE